jgi:hypothetical protein
MDEIIYNAFGSYYNALEKLGYISYPQSQKLLLLCFYRDFVFHDYRGLLNKEDYYLIERALDCLWGSTCLIPYPDYLKMGKLHLAEVTELASRIKNFEDTSVLKAFDAEGASGDIIITAEEEEK